MTIRLPKTAKKSLIAVLIPILGWFVVIHILSARVEKVVISGNDVSTVETLRHMSGIRNGSRLWSVNLDTVKQDVERHTWVQNATVRWIDLRLRTVEVRITERKPVALLRVKGGFRYVDGSGDIFADANPADLDYPILAVSYDQQGVVHPGLPKLVLEQALDLLGLLDQLGAISTSQISEITFTLADGFGVVLNESGHRVKVGHGNMNAKVSRLVKVLDAERNTLNSPLLIDLTPRSLAVVTPLTLSFPT